MPANLFDLQVNGFAGVDFQRVVTLEAVQLACQRLRQSGTSAILATFITDSAPALEKKLARFAAFRREDPLIAETIVGFHLEGPFLSAEPGFRGAHDPASMMDPCWNQFETWQSAAEGNIRLVTLAPERPRSTWFIKQAVGTGVRISLGHTNASNDQIEAAIAAGATLCTHLGNGCPPTLPRHDNIIQRLLARDELIACLIPDGTHLPPMMLKNIVRAKPPGTVILTTDAMAAADCQPGRYTLGPHELEVGLDGVVRMPGSDQFAGSALRLDRGVENAARWLNLDLSSATAMASTIPAHALGFSL